jgi:PAS domain S-box-containing protein
MPWDGLDKESIIYFVRHTAVVSWVVDANGHSMNIDEWMELTGLSETQARGGGWLSAVHPDDVARVRSAWDTALHHGTPYNTDYRIRCADGIYRWFNARGVQLLDPSGRPRDWIGVILPIAASGHLRGPTGVTIGNSARSIDPGALRAARGLLNLSTEDLAAGARVGRSTVRRLEQDGGSAKARAEIVQRVLAYLHQRGARFLVRDGIAVGVTSGT